jgi:hypothetical protein
VLEKAASKFGFNVKLDGFEYGAGYIVINFQE